MQHTYLPNIARSKGSKTIKLGHLLEYNMRNIFVEKSYTKCGGENSTRPYFKKLELNISLDQVLYGLSILYANLTAIKIYWNYVAYQLHLPHKMLF